MPPFVKKLSVSQFSNLQELLTRLYDFSIEEGKGVTTLRIFTGKTKAKVVMQRRQVFIKGDIYSKSDISRVMFNFGKWMVKREGGRDRWIFLGVNNDYAMSSDEDSDDDSDDDTSFAMV
jgi:hypothetical protein